ncbi:MAG TPA: DUF1080 domain-containing protein [Bacteroidales bacterium]|nr:DUF1080 domain-containing protein [Bacteroidales bacterium]HOK74537.1 DUF1080 domain-containing protein [Bacteroidales bacterium]HPP92709.1 DUF1080 domain-containing protein [Bacteroidales bacterium]HQK71870.1 DUF1080 domain-containing protein [Bacteroidales bacterium]HRR17358.1 DUF1080 domain-containing protein [Bacteroidales bacterium]
MKKLFTISLMLLAIGVVTAQQQTRPAQQGQPGQLPQPARMTPEMTEIWEPEVPIVEPGAQPGMPPSDAIILFDGSEALLNKEWEDARGNPTKWIVKNGELVCVKGSGPIKTKRKFTDFQLHIEWKTPSEVTGEGQGRGNSGVYLQELYEVQILDSYNNRTYRNGQAGSIYKQYAPLVNASRKPGEWQTYDIIYTAPRFGNDSTSYFTPPRVTVLHNGVLIQNNVSLRGPTLYIGIPEYSIKKHGPGSILLQDHGNPVAFRNIWVREL